MPINLTTGEDLTIEEVAEEMRRNASTSVQDDADDTSAELAHADELIDQLRARISELETLVQAKDRELASQRRLIAAFNRCTQARVQVQA